ncbi:MAG: glycosyl transferase [Rhodospirillaceae bacterium]|nr:glycosyl transferase [Rhodospirillaceae bacterium]|tara:strand:+ start:3286 stop:4326 length:1041 start_codon:yes stop_codon:yes gene_type:complete
MRVLHLMAGAESGGAETFFGRLVVALQKTNIDQRVITRYAQDRQSLLNKASVEYATASFGGLADWKTHHKIRREIGLFGPDIVVSWMNRPTRFVPKKSPRKAHRFVHLGSPRGYYAPKYYKHCEHLVVTTDDLAKFYESHGRPSEEITVIPNFAPDLTARSVSRSDFDTPEKAPLLLALGRLHKNKGFDILLKAMLDLPDHYLWLGGDGPLEQELKALAFSLGVANRVRFLGWLPDAAPYYAAADIFVCSSRHEPFGNIIIESWLHSTPIVATASEGPGALIDDAKTGLIVPNEDVAALATAIRKLRGDAELCDLLAVSGRKRYVDAFTEERVVGGYRDLFERLVN